MIKDMKGEIFSLQSQLDLGDKTHIGLEGEEESEIQGNLIRILFKDRQTDVIGQYIAINKTWATSHNVPFMKKIHQEMSSEHV